MSHCRNRQAGYVLIAVLFFMQIYTLLILANLSAQSVDIKNAEQCWYRQRIIWRAEGLLKKLENRDTKLCRIVTMSAVELAAKSLKWWQHFTCSGNFLGFGYHYAVEALEKDVCNVLENHTVAEFYRITLLMLPDKLRGANVILQSTISKSSREASSCHKHLRIFRIGRQMLREL